MRKAFFLDRDGTVNVEVDYLHKCEDMVLIDGAVQAIRLIHEAGYLALIVSNQAGIADGRYTMEDVKILENFMRKEMAKVDPLGVPDAFYYCPHHPKRGKVKELVRKCSCRKPETGMLLTAQKEWDVDLAGSFMIGDKLADVEAGMRASCRKSVLVLTGHGNEDAAEAVARGVTVCEDILQAVKSILGK